MKILFDQGTPSPLRRALAGHDVRTAHKMGWSELTNGRSLAAAEGEGFDVIVTTDQSMRHQQDLAGRKLGVIVLLTTDWNKIRGKTTDVKTAVESLRPGEVREVAFDD